MDFVGTGQRLTPEDYGRVAAIISIPAATLRGVVDVEAAGSGFDAANRPKILTEGHQFWRLLGPGAKRTRATEQGLAWPKWGDRPYPKGSDACYARLAAMMAIDEPAALEATSWGLPQIMGFNCAAAGYANSREMVEAFKTGEAEQLAALVRLIDAWDLEGALRRRDAAGFARRYNGPGYAKNAYDTKLSAAWSRRDRDLEVKEGASVPTAPRVPAFEPSKEAIEHLQSVLIELGCDPGPVDGLRGRKTKQAVAALLAKL